MLVEMEGEITEALAKVVIFGGGGGDGGGRSIKAMSSGELKEI